MTSQAKHVLSSIRLCAAVRHAGSAYMYCTVHVYSTTGRVVVWHTNVCACSNRSCREKAPRVAKTSAGHRMFPTLKFLLMMQENLVLVRTCSSHGGISTTYSSTTYSSMFEPVRNQNESLDSGCVAHAMAVRTKPLRLGGDTINHV